MKVEPLIRTVNGMRKTGLVAINNGDAVIFDVQIMKGSNVGNSHVAKIRKYKDIAGFDDVVKAKFGM